MTHADTQRIPPPSERLEFARNTETRRVHILCGEPARYWLPSTWKGNPEAATILGLLSTPCRMLCGAKLLVGVDDRQRAVWEAGNDFTDDDLCFSCVRALGDQQWRAFHADNRGGDDNLMPAHCPHGTTASHRLSIEAHNDAAAGH